MTDPDLLFTAKELQIDLYSFNYQYIIYNHYLSCSLFAVFRIFRTLILRKI